MFSFSSKVPIISTLPTKSSLFVRLESKLAPPLVASSTSWEIKLLLGTCVKSYNAHACSRRGLLSDAHTMFGTPSNARLYSQRSPGLLTNLPLGQLCSLRLPAVSHLTPFSSSRTLPIFAALHHYQMLLHPRYSSNCSVRSTTVPAEETWSSKRLRDFPKVTLGLGPQLQLELPCISLANILGIKGNNRYKSPFHSNTHCKNARDSGTISQKLLMAAQV